MLKRYSLILFVAIVMMFLIAGCTTLAKQPQITRASIDPPTLHPGDSAVITLEVRDKHRIVSRMEGVVLEDPRVTFRLRDDGQDPDAKAKDGIWSMRVDVPFQAPPGEFQLEFTAYDRDGEPISIRDKQKRVVPMKQLIQVRIVYPNQ